MSDRWKIGVAVAGGALVGFTIALVSLAISIHRDELAAGLLASLAASSAAIAALLSVQWQIRKDERSVLANRLAEIRQYYIKLFIELESYRISCLSTYTDNKKFKPGEEIGPNNMMHLKMPPAPGSIKDTGRLAKLAQNDSFQIYSLSRHIDNINGISESYKENDDQFKINYIRISSAEIFMKISSLLDDIGKNIGWVAHDYRDQIDEMAESVNDRTRRDAQTER